MKTIKLDAKETAALERFALDPRHNDNARAVLNFAYGKVCEDNGRYADAFAAFARANTIVRRGIQWDAAAFSREIDETQRIFSATVAASPAALGSEVIFVVGLPRSSTTLIEQILAAHPSVEGASELPDLPAVIRRNRNGAACRFRSGPSTHRPPTGSASAATISRARRAGALSDRASPTSCRTTGR